MQIFAISHKKNKKNIEINKCILIGEQKNESNSSSSKGIVQSQQSSLDQESPKKE